MASWMTSWTRGCWSINLIFVSPLTKTKLVTLGQMVLEITKGMENP
jgi:hypothetical protein